METFSLCIGTNFLGSRGFTQHLHALTRETDNVRFEVLSIASENVRKAHEEFNTSASNTCLNICVSYDGTWHKRGHTSNYGIGFVMDTLTGLVLDFEVLSKYCAACNVKARCLGRNSEQFVKL